MTTEEKHDRLNQLADETFKNLDAGSVVMLALTRGENGRPQLLVATAGVPDAMEFVADRMPELVSGIKRSAREARQSFAAGNGARHAYSEQRTVAVRKHGMG